MSQQKLGLQKLTLSDEKEVTIPSSDDSPATQAKNSKVVEQFQNYTAKIKNYKAIFKKYDQNNDGFLSAEEIKQMFADQNESAESALKWLKEFDKDGNKVLDWNEFKDAMDKREMLQIIPDYKDSSTKSLQKDQKELQKEKQQKQAEYNTAVNRFADGFRSMHKKKLEETKKSNPHLSQTDIDKLETEPLTKDDLVDAFLTDSNNFKSQSEANEAVQKLIESADSDGNGVISFYEFREYLENAIYGPKHPLQSPKPLTTPLTYSRSSIKTGQHTGSHTHTHTQVPARPSMDSTPKDSDSKDNSDNKDKEQKLNVQSTAVPGQNMGQHTKPAKKEQRRSLVQQNHAAMLSYVDRMRKAHDLFKQADTNHTGKISAAQLESVFGDEAHADWLAAFDKDVSGELTWEQFRDAMDASAKVPVTIVTTKEQKEEGKETESKRDERIQKQNEDIKRFADLFHKFKASSSDKNSPITREELFKVLSADPTHMGLANDAMTATAAFLQEADKTHKNSISWSEFLEYMQKHGLQFH